MENEDPTLIGEVRDVRGPTVHVAFVESALSGLTFLNGESHRIGQPGSFVRIPIGLLDLFGVVSQVGAGAAPDQGVDEQVHGERWMTVQIIGEGRRGEQFRRGVSQYPTFGNKVHLVTGDDLAEIYGRPDSPEYVEIGRLSGASSIPALVDVNRLVTRHSAVVGNTGSGKSTTVAGLLKALTDSQQYPSARVMLLDIHGEYARAFSDRANVLRVDADREAGEKELYVPYWALNVSELLSMTFGNLAQDTERRLAEEISDRRCRALKELESSSFDPESFTADTPAPFSIHKLWYDLHCEINATHYEQRGNQSPDSWALQVDENGEPIERGDPLRVVPPKFRGIKNDAGDDEKIYLSDSTLNVGSALSGLASRLRDSRFDFLYNCGSWRPDEDGIPEADLDELLDDWIGREPGVTILDLSGVPSTVLHDLIGAILRIVYDCLFWARNFSEGGRERPLFLVLEEGHKYLRPDANNSAADSVQQIVKEGRKYGLGTMIVSQRPSEIDPTILSQCGTFFALRLGNSRDRAQVRGIASDNLSAIFDMLPTLRTGEAIIAGEAVHLPTRAQITPPPDGERPDSEDPVIYEDTGPGGWNRPDNYPEDYAAVLRAWRQRRPEHDSEAETFQERSQRPQPLEEEENE